MKAKKLLAGAVAMTVAAVQMVPLGSSLVYAEPSQNEAPAAPEAFGPTPSEGQMKYFKDELAAFLHFGMNTFTGVEWGNGTEDPDRFNPTDLDTDQWMEVLTEAGFKRAILTAKHHDGFALWPTEYSENKRSVESSSWRDGEGDVVQEFVDSCVKYDMDIGFYLSPWDAGNPEYPSNYGRDYNDIYVGQMKELFNYVDEAGEKVVEFWLDGANGGNNRPTYDIQRWWDTLYEHNPNIVFQQNYGAPLRWCGNESGYSDDNCWQILNKKYVWDLYAEQGREDKAYLHVGEPYDPEKAKNTDEYEYVWSTSEVDVSIRSGWFHGSQPKSAEKLIDMYFDSVGLGSPFLLNVPPNKEGKIDDADIAVLKEFREILDNTFTVNLASEDRVISTSASAVRGGHEAYGPANVVDDDYDTYWTMDDGQTTGSVVVELNQPTLIDVIQIQEYIPLGQRIASFTTEVKVNGEWQEFGKGGTIGYKRLVKGAPVRAEAIRVNITEAKAVPLINNISAYKADERIEEDPKVVPGKIQAEDFASLSNAISENKGPNGGGNLGAVKDGATAVYNGFEFKQTPREFTLCYSGEKSPEITLRLDSADGPVIAQMTVESAGSYNNYITQTVPVTYEGEPITGIHSLVLCMNSGLNVDWFELTGNNILSVSPTKMSVYEGDNAQFTVKRTGDDLSEEVSVTVLDYPDTAVQGQNYEMVNETVTLAPGEAEKTIEIQTIHDVKTAEDLKFSIELQNASANALIGTDGKAVITVLDLDSGDVDTSALESAISQAESLDGSIYTPESWEALQTVVNEAKALLETGADRKQIDEMVTKLETAMEALADLQYTESNPIVFPTETGQTVITEGEDWKLVPLEGASGSRIQIEKGAANGSCSKGLSVGYWKNGDTMSAPVVISKAGTYTIGLVYSSGSNPSAPNTVRISGDGITPAGDVVFTPNYPSLDTQTVDVEVSKEAVSSGPVVLTIEAVANGGPILDQVQITLKEVKESKPVSKTTLEYFLNRAKSYMEDGTVDGLVESVQKLFAEAIAEGDAVMADENATYDEVLNAAFKLMKAVQAVDMKAADKTDLQMAVELGDMIDLTKYVPDGQGEFLAAMDTAKAFLADGDAMQDETDAAWNTLVDAMSALRLKADKTALKDLINNVKNIDLSAYTEESAAVFRTAFAAANVVLEDETLSVDSQTSVDEAVQMLKVAKDGLVKKDDGNTGDGTGGDAGNTGDGTSGDAGNTGDGTSGDAGTGTGENSGADTGTGNGTGSEEDGSTLNKDHTPKTGDTALPVLWSGLCVFGFAAAGSIVWIRKKYADKNR